MLIEEELMATRRYICKECGASLELFATLYSRMPIDESTGEIGEELEENIPGSDRHFEVQCSQDADHDCGFTY